MGAEAVMETITVQVVYEKGVLKPKSKLPFPEKSILEARVKPANGKKQSAFGSLIGIWAGLSDADVRDLEKSLAKARRATGLKVKKISSKK